MPILLMFLISLIVLHLIINKKITGQTGDNRTKVVQIMVPLKYLSNFWITLDVPLINYEINISLTWSNKCIIVTGYYGDQEPKLPIIDIKHLCSSCGLISLRLRNIAAVKNRF